MTFLVWSILSNFSPGLEEHLADIALIITRLEKADAPVVTLPDPSVSFVTRLLLEKRDQLGFTFVFTDLLGRDLFRWVTLFGAVVL